MELLKKHRSVRSYKSESISDDLINLILECGIRGSNTGNMQLYSVIVSKDFDNRKALLPLHFNQKMVTDAPVLLTICIDINRFNKWCEISNTSTDMFNLIWLLNSTIDCSILAQNISIAAEEYGLGICYLGTTLYNALEISEFLDLPDGVVPITAITMGYPEVYPELVDRLPLEAVVHYEKYIHKNNDEISEIYFEKEKREDSRKFVSENGMKNLAEVYTKIRYNSNDNLKFSTKLIDMLKNQGFKFY